VCLTPLHAPHHSSHRLPYCGECITVTRDSPAWPTPIWFLTDSFPKLLLLRRSGYKQRSRQGLFLSLPLLLEESLPRSCGRDRHSCARDERAVRPFSLGLFFVGLGPFPSSIPLFTTVRHQGRWETFSSPRQTPVFPPVLFSHSSS